MISGVWKHIEEYFQKTKINREKEEANLSLNKIFVRTC